MSGPFLREAGLPVVPFLKDLINHVRAAQEFEPGPQSQPIINDAVSNQSFGRDRLLQDTFAFRDHLFGKLKGQSKVRLDSSDEKEEVFLCILLPASYDFLVAFLAVISLGAIAVLLRRFLCVNVAGLLRSFGND